MGYCGIGDIQGVRVSELELIQLTDDTGAGAVDMDVLNAAIGAAQTEVDAVLAAIGLSVPLAQPPELIRVITADLALPRLYMKRFDATELPQAIRDQAKQARQLLSDIREGKLALPSLAAGSSAGVYLSNKASTDRRFSRELLDSAGGL